MMKPSLNPKTNYITLLVVIFPILLGLSLIFCNRDSRVNYSHLSVTLLNSPVSFRIILNCFFLLLFFTLYIFFHNKFIDIDLDKTRYTEHKNIFMIFTIIFSFLPAAINLFGISPLYFRLFGLGHPLPNFLDLRGTLAAINKVSYVGQGYQIDCEIQPCIGWRWTYGSLILHLKSLYIFKESLTWVYASIFLILFLWTYTRISQKPAQSFIYLLLIPTGTFMLVIERMNLDILLLPLIYFLAIFSVSKWRLVFILPSVVFIAASIKYYPIILFIPLIYLANSLRLRVFYSIFSLITLLFILPEIKLADPKTMSFGYSGTYGLKNALGIINASVEPSFIFNSIQSIVFILSLVIVVFYTSKKFTFDFINYNFFNLRLYIYGFSILISTWLLSSNYPYRLVCTLAMIPFLVDVYKKNCSIISSAISMLIIFFAAVPISLTPIRTLLVSGFIAINTGILLSIFQKTHK